MDSQKLFFMGVVIADSGIDVSITNRYGKVVFELSGFQGEPIQKIEALSDVSLHVYSECISQSLYSSITDQASSVVIYDSTDNTLEDRFPHMPDFPIKSSRDAAEYAEIICSV